MVRVLARIGAAIGAAFLLNHWRQKRREMREAQARGDRVEVLARLRELEEQQRQDRRASN